MWTFCFIFSAGWAVPEEKQKDAGHFDPLCHSHCSNNYSFWDKVLILHSSGFCFLCGCLLCICVDLDEHLGSVQNNAWLPFVPTRKHLKNSPELSEAALRVVETLCGRFYWMKQSSLYEPCVFSHVTWLTRLCRVYLGLYVHIPASW